MDHLPDRECASLALAAERTESEPAGLEACRELIRAFRWRTKLVAEAAKHAGLTEELAEKILTFIGLTQDALASEIWILARWTRVACTSWAYMEEAFHWWSTPWIPCLEDDALHGPFC